jgi:hypothetical protein
MNAKRYLVIFGIIYLPLIYLTLFIQLYFKKGYPLSDLISVYMGAWWLSYYFTKDHKRKFTKNEIKLFLTGTTILDFLLYILPTSIIRCGDNFPNIVICILCLLLSHFFVLWLGLRKIPDYWMKKCF